jgi:hypothetical protein
MRVWAGLDQRFGKFPDNTSNINCEISARFDIDSICRRFGKTDVRLINPTVRDQDIEAKGRDLKLDRILVGH